MNLLILVVKLSKTKTSKSKSGIKIEMVSKSIIIAAIIIALSLIVFAGLDSSTTKGIFIDGPIDVNITEQLNGSMNINITEPIDNLVDAVITIDLQHHEVHEGDHFFICNATELNNGDTADFIVSTNGSFLHMSFSLEGTSQTEITVHEGVTFLGGEDVEAMNNNRNSTKTTNATFYLDSGIIDFGKQIFRQSAGLKGLTPSRADLDGTLQLETELILNQPEDYLFRISSQDNDNIISYCGTWYEVE